jgi:undecaprenyl-diphosphatase
MTILQAFILGIIQGITEFLPISSSGHLVIMPFIFGWDIPAEQIFPFDVLVQMGTLLAVIIYFWKDLSNIFISLIKGIFNKKPFSNNDAKLGWYLIIATIPAVIGGLLFKDVVESAFQSIVATAIFLLVTAVLLISSEHFGKHNKELHQISWINAILIGFFQVLSIFPGISRSGSTIAGGVFQNIKREDAARFSFLMSIPVMFGAGLLSIFDLFKITNLGNFLPVLLIGFITSGIIGYLSIHWLLKFLNKHKLSVFAIYCILLSFLVLIINYLH